MGRPNKIHYGWRFSGVSSVKQRRFKMEQVNAIIDVIVQWIPLALTVVGAFSVIATQTANKTDNKIAQVMLEIINFFAMNLGKSKNDPNV